MASKKDKGRLTPFVPLLKETLDAPAWLALSHGAKCLYVALKRKAPPGNNRAYLSYREARRTLRASQHKVKEWFAELEFYGFIVLAKHGSLGVEGKGKAPHWWLTELGHAARGGTEFPSKDYLRWRGELFDPTPYRDPRGPTRWEKQNPVSDVRYTPYRTGGTPVYRTDSTPDAGSVSDGVNIELGQGVSDGVNITRLTTGEAAEGAAEPLDYRLAALAKRKAR